MERKNNSECRIEFKFFLLLVPLHWQNRLPSGKIMFYLKYRCPHCKLLPDSTTDHDHLLICINSRNQNTQWLVFLTIWFDKLHTLPQLRNNIVHHVDNYNNNDLLSDPPITKTTLILKACITHQTSIGWRYFIRDRLISSFHPVINQYYRTNKLRWRFHSSVWYRTIVRLLWKMHH